MREGRLEKVRGILIEVGERSCVWVAGSSLIDVKTEVFVNGFMIVASGYSWLTEMVGKFVESSILYVVAVCWWSTGFFLYVVFELKLL